MDSCAPSGGHGSSSCQPRQAAHRSSGGVFVSTRTTEGKETMTEKSSKPGREARRAEATAPRRPTAARGAAVGPAKLTRKRLGRRAVWSTGGRCMRFTLTAPSGWRHADTLRFRTSSGGTPLMLRVEAIVIAGAAVSAAPDEPQRAVREARCHSTVVPQFSFRIDGVPAGGAAGLGAAAIDSGGRPATGRGE